MRNEQTQYTVAAKKRSPRKKNPKDTPVLKNVVSLRVSDQEKRLLERLTRATSQNVSDLVREAIGFWLAKRHARSSSKVPSQSLQMVSQ